jgi:hypothetical protein
MAIHSAVSKTKAKPVGQGVVAQGETVTVAVLQKGRVYGYKNLPMIYRNEPAVLEDLLKEHVDQQKKRGAESRWANVAALADELEQLTYQTSDGEEDFVRPMFEIKRDVPRPNNANGTEQRKPRRILRN